MYDVIKIPMRVIDDIDDIPNVYDSFLTGEIFFYDPDNGFHQQLLDNGFIKHFDKNECEYFCDIPYMTFDSKEYIKGDKLDVSNAQIHILNTLSELGQIKKVFKEPERQFSAICKDFAFESFADFKAKVKELCNIDISHHFNKATKEEEEKIREALK